MNLARNLLVTDLSRKYSTTDLVNITYIMGEFAQHIDLERINALSPIESIYPDLAVESGFSGTTEAGGDDVSPRIMYWYHPDYVGNVDLVTDVNQQAHEMFLYNPWGESLYHWESGTSSWSSPYRFNSKELDSETGMHYYGARYHHPRLSVWMSVDPLAIYAPHLTPYRFTYNNPLVYVDPDGLFEDEAAAKKYQKDNSTGGQVVKLSKGIWAIYDEAGGVVYQQFNSQIVETIGLLNEATVRPKDLGYFEETWDSYTNEQIASLHPHIRSEVSWFINDAAARGIYLRIPKYPVPCGLRTYEEQNKLYSQGRTAPGRIVTYARGGQSYHNFGLAFDVYQISNGQMVKFDPRVVVPLAEEYGFYWGGNFDDPPHFEKTFGLRWRELNKRYNSGQRPYPNLK